MRIQYQGGCIRRAKRRNGPDVWEYLWREETSDGKRIRHTQVIGTVDQYPTKELASIAVNGLRARVNEDAYRLQLRPIMVGDLIDHFIQTILYDEPDLYAAATRIVVPDTINRWIRPQWGGLNIRGVRTIAVKRWLKKLLRKDGKPLANATKAKIRNVMRRLFNHAITYEWLKQGENPIKHVRQSAAREKEPEPLEPDELQRLLIKLESPFRELVFLDAVLGLRRSELFALKWRDFDFARRVVNIERNIVYGVIGHCKSRKSRTALPIPPLVAAALCSWREQSQYQELEDWVFASPRMRGKTPLTPQMPMRNHIREAALEAGISKRIHWHGFRYTLATWIIANGEDIKVAQELLRHASPLTTLQFYAAASEKKKRDALERIEDMIFPHDENEPCLPLEEPAPSSDVPLYASDQEKRQALECVESMMLLNRRFMDAETMHSDEVSDDLASKSYSGDQQDYLM